MNNKTLKKIHAVFHTGSTYDCHFVIKELAEEFEGQFECLGENTEKYLTVLMPIKKELDNGKKSTYKIKFIDSFTFMFSSLSNVVDNLFDGVHYIICRGCNSYREYISIEEDELLEFNCLECTKNHQKFLTKN